VNQRPHRWQHSCHPAGESGTTVAGVVVGNESVFGNWSRSDGQLSNMPLQLTRAVQLSVDGQRAGGARLNRRSKDAARPRQCYYPPSRNGPCS
jgi:hypothetical protein